MPRLTYILLTMTLLVGCGSSTSPDDGDGDAPSETADASTASSSSSDSGLPRCSSGSDCIEGYVCDEKRGRCARSCYRASDCPNDRICRNDMCRPRNTTCNDRDGDGYGASSSPDLSACSACQQGKKNGCQPDCRDSNPRIHPGATDTCDGADNDCDANIDEPVPCTSSGDCSLNAPADRQNTSIRCERANNKGKNKVRECVLKGSFSANQQCNADENKATCQKGSWGSLPEACTTPP
ncbi:MAG: putative metal-binding motif-containing protein [Bradymonadaceae bacterium]